MTSGLPCWLCQKGSQEEGRGCGRKQPRQEAAESLSEHEWVLHRHHPGQDCGAQDIEGHLTYHEWPGDGHHVGEAEVAFLGVQPSPLLELIYDRPYPEHEQEDGGEQPGQDVEERR